MEFFNSALGRNITFVRPAYFIISGFVGIPNVKYYYVFLFVVYIFSVLGNTAVMALIYYDHNLRTPKYIAIFSLALVDLLSSCALVPKTLDIFLFNHNQILYNDCMTFLFFCYICSTMQALNLLALSYDRVMAILYPLHYQTKLTNKSMYSLIIFLWVISIFVVVLAVGLLTRLSFCNSVIIRSYFCDHGQMYRLACNDNSPSFIISILLPVIILWLPLTIILCSYLSIGYALSKVATFQERLKALKTCTAHLSLVSIFFFPIIVTYTMLGSIHPNARILNLSLASVLPPMLNPIIYVLQTQEIKDSLKKLIRVRIQSKRMIKIVTNR